MNNALRRNYLWKHLLLYHGLPKQVALHRTHREKNVANLEKFIIYDYKFMQIVSIFCIPKILQLFIQYQEVLTIFNRWAERCV
jgi:hypothetical protein